ncbi:MAG: hypothetical protein SGJ27_15865 [Candidatus Melainabacteria bacterium]|nr:hypothetical protein [Candidatus Melainabacteria bacterium]
MNFNSIGKSIKAASKSDIAIALLCFALLDIGVGIAYAVNHKPMQFGYDVPFRSRSWYALNDYSKQPSTPDLVLLGASDMTCALYGAEATYQKKSISQLTNHRSTYLESQLEKAAAPYKSTFCLAIPGQMPSDQYFMARTLVENGAKPKALYCTMVPRNFFDATFKSPASSDVFKTTSKLGGTGEYEIICRKKDVFSIFDHLLSRASSVYGHKQELTSWQHHVVQGIVRPDNANFDTVKTSIELRKLAMMDLPEDFAPDEVGQAPFDPKHNVFADNMQEYRVRYSQFSMKIWKEQFGFFEKLCELCKAEGIDLVVGNSPLTAENLAMVTKDTYKLYLDQVSSTVRSNGGIFVDLNLPGLFEHDDFSDSVHLNGKGGEKFLTYVAGAMSKRSLAQSSNVQQK